MVDYALHLLIGVAMGYLIAIPLGPVNLAVVQASISFGTTNGTRLGVGSALAEGLYCALAAAGVSLFLGKAPDTNAAVFVLELLSIPLLVFLGVYNLLEKVGEKPPSEIVKGARGFLLGFMLNLFNPVLLPLWLGVTGFLRGREIIGAETGLLLIYAMGVTFGTFLLHYTVARLSGRRNFALNPRVRWIVTRSIGWAFLLIALYQTLNILYVRLQWISF